MSFERNETEGIVRYLSHKEEELRAVTNPVVGWLQNNNRRNDIIIIEYGGVRLLSGEAYLPAEVSD